MAEHKSSFSGFLAKYLVYLSELRLYYMFKDNYTLVNLQN